MKFTVCYTRWPSSVNRARSPRRNNDPQAWVICNPPYSTTWNSTTRRWWFTWVTTLKALLWADPCGRCQRKLVCSLRDPSCGECDWSSEGHILPSEQGAVEAVQYLSSTVAFPDCVDSVFFRGAVSCLHCLVKKMNDDLRENIIQHVFTFPAIWDKNHQHHHNRYVLEKRWKTVASKIGLPGKMFLISLTVVHVEPNW